MLPKFHIVQSSIFGNTASICRFFGEFGVISPLNIDESGYTSSACIPDSDIIVLPGVGSFSSAISHVRDTRLDHLLKNHYANNGKIIGICLGFQMLGLHSDESDVDSNGLDLIKNLSFSDLRRHKGMKMNVGIRKLNHSISSLANVEYGYFMHQYAALVSENSNLEPSNQLITTRISGHYHIISAVISDNIIGIQFHPEKSGAFGVKAMSSILNICK